MPSFHRAAADGQTFPPGGGIIQLSLPVLQVPCQPVQRMLCLSSHLNTMVETMQNAARLGMHTVTPEDLQGIIRRAKAANPPRGAQTTIIEALTECDEHLADTVLQDPPGRWTKRVNKKQALKLLHAARQNGIDAHTMAELASVMGYDPTDLQIAVPALTKYQFDTIVDAVEKAGLPKNAATRVIEALL